MKYRLILLLLIVPFIAFGQIKRANMFEIEFSDAYEGNIFGYLGYPHENTHLFYVNNKKSFILAKQFYASHPYSTQLDYSRFYFEKFESSTLEIQKHEIIESLFSLVEAKIVQLSDSNIYVFYQEWDKHKKNLTPGTSYLYRKLNIETLKLGEPKKLFTTNRGVYSGNYSISLSQDSTKILFECWLNRSSKKVKNRTVYALHVFDINLNSIWHIEVNINVIKSGYREVYEKMVCNNGDVKLLVGCSENNYKSIYVLTCNKDKNTIDSLAIDTNIRYLRFKTIEKSNNEFLSIGYYDKDLKNVDGIFGFRFDENSNISNYFTIPFSDEIMKQYASEGEVNLLNKYKEKQWSGIRYLDVRDVSFNENGDYVLFGERYSRCVGNISETRHGYNNTYYEDIYITVIDTTGNLKTLVKVPKRQRYANRFVRNSGLYYREGNYSYFFTTENYLDKDQNTMLTPRMVYLTYGNLIVYRINEKTGTIHKQFLIDNSKYEEIKLKYYSPGKLVKIAPGKVILEYSFKKKKDRMFTFTKYRMFTFTLNDEWVDILDAEESEYPDDTED